MRSVLRWKVRQRFDGVSNCRLGFRVGEIGPIHCLLLVRR